MTWLFLRLFSFFGSMLPKFIRGTALGEWTVALFTVATVLYPGWVMNSLWRYWCKSLNTSELIHLLSLGLF